MRERSVPPKAEIASSGMAASGRRSRAFATRKPPASPWHREGKRLRSSALLGNRNYETQHLGEEDLPDLSPPHAHRKFEPDGAARDGPSRQQRFLPPGFPLPPGALPPEKAPPGGAGRQGAG